MPVAYIVRLPEPSNQDQGDIEITSVLYQNDIPTEPDFFSYIDENQIEISTESFSDANFYQFRYNRLTRLQSEVLDLGNNFLDYEWYLDVCAYVRRNLITKQELVSEQLRLAAGLEYILENPALTTGGFSLRRTNGVITEELPPSAVTFINNRRIQIEGRFFDVGYIYTFTYTALVIERNPTVSLIYEYRTAATQLGVLEKEWRQFEVNDIADTRFSLEDNNNKRYIQFRITADNIKRIEDLHIYSITARGLLIPNVEDRQISNQGFSVIAVATAAGNAQLVGTRAYGITDRADAVSELTPLLGIPRVVVRSSTSTQSQLTFSLEDATVPRVHGEASGSISLIGDSDSFLSLVSASASINLNLVGDADGSLSIIPALASANISLNGDSDGYASISGTASSSAELDGLSAGQVPISSQLIDSYTWEDGVDFGAYTILGDFQNFISDPRPTIIYSNPNSGSTRVIGFNDNAGELIEASDFQVPTSPFNALGIGSDRINKGITDTGAHTAFNIREPASMDVDNINLTSSGFHMRMIINPIPSSGPVISQNTRNQNNQGWRFQVIYFSSSSEHRISTLVNANDGVNTASGWLPVDANTYDDADEVGSINTVAGINRNLPVLSPRWYLVDFVLSETTPGNSRAEVFINGSRQVLELTGVSMSGVMDRNIDINFTPSFRNNGILFFGYRYGIIDLATHQAERIAAGLVY